MQRLAFIWLIDLRNRVALYLCETCHKPDWIYTAARSFEALQVNMADGEVPFTVAPVPSEDPVRKDKKQQDSDGDENGNGKPNGVDTTLVDGKPTVVNGKDDAEEELVSVNECTIYRTSGTDGVGTV